MATEDDGVDGVDGVDDVSRRREEDEVHVFTWFVVGEHTASAQITFMHIFCECLTETNRGLTKSS